MAPLEKRSSFSKVGVTQVSANWNQLVRELYQWQEFGKLFDAEKALV